jgi:hypothetical protein
MKHVAECGFTAVQLMPMAEASDAWGYNPRQLMSLHGACGTPDVSGSLQPAWLSLLSAGHVRASNAMR